MTQLATNISLHNSLLIRTLVVLGVHRPVPTRSDVAQALAQHISFVDAAALTELFDPKHLAPELGTPKISARQDYEKVRSAAESCVRQSFAGTQTGTRLALPTGHDQSINDVAGGFGPYRKYHHAHQQNIEFKVRPLRSKVRDIVAKCSPRLQQLAELDAACEGILGELEARRLSNVTTRLEMRFNTLREEHRRFVDLHHVPDGANLWLSPSGWLTHFHQDLQTILMAELDLRMLPVLGLIEAYEAEPSLNT